MQEYIHTCKVTMVTSRELLVKRLVYAYKGIFNKNLDLHWSGGILLDPEKVVDLCTRFTSKSGSHQPAPYVSNNLGGLSFDKYLPYVYTSSSDVYSGSLSSPDDYRWIYCYLLPTNISSSRRYQTQMTLAIYVC